MANGDCCKLVGSLSLNFTDGCIVSVSTSSKAELIQRCDDTTVLLGPTVGTVNMSGYTALPGGGTEYAIHTGCAGKAGVSVSWVRRYDCDTDTVYFISNGEGSSFVAGPVEGYASLNLGSGRTYTSMSASSASGPASLYMSAEQEDGYGMKYDGGPISFDTATSLEFPNFIEAGGPTLYLQSFNLELQPGEIPTASYSFAFSVAAT